MNSTDAASPGSGRYTDLLPRSQPRTIMEPDFTE